MAKKVVVAPYNMRLIKAPIRKGVYEKVSQALYDDHQLELTYLAASSNTGQAKTYAVHSYGLVHRDTTTELIGRIDGKNELSRFLLHRIEKAKVLASKSRIPGDFNLEQYCATELAHPYSGQTIRFRAWLTKDRHACNHVLETRLSDDQTIEYVEDGLIVTADIPETVELKWWILGMGDRIKVLAPETLKEDIAQTVSSMAALYTNRG